MIEDLEWIKQQATDKNIFLKEPLKSFKYLHFIQSKS